MGKLEDTLKRITPLRKVVRALKTLVNDDDGNPYRKHRKSLEKKDKKNASERPELIPLHKKLQELKLAQSNLWNSYVYCDGYFYQGYRRIGINGIKPTEDRFEKYEIEKYLTSEKTVLNIGSNSGFVVCYLSEFVKEVDGIELNPFLNEMGKTTANFLNIHNGNFNEGDFVEYDFTRTYDIIFSLSNHFTIDGNLNIGFELYIQKIFNNLNDDGMMFFESHNVRGDDKDMDLKFEIASKYFSLIDYKMVKAFYSADIDKLFAVFKRLDKPGPAQALEFKLSSAIHKYTY